MCIYLNLMILIKIIRGFISAEWQKELQRREQVKAERRTYGENLRSATHSAGRSRAAIVADLESGGNWMDSL